MRKHPAFIGFNHKTEVKARLQALAARQERHPAELLRDALDAYLDSHKAPKRPIRKRRDER